jgi:IS30 family transposase
MGRCYPHITYEQRISISTLKRAGKRVAEIVEQLGLHRSTIYRELKRNGRTIGYHPFLADRKLKDRKHCLLKLNYDTDLRLKVVSGLRKGWSPEQIAGRLRRNNNGISVICHETIYRYIYSENVIRNRW